MNRKDLFLVGVLMGLAFLSQPLLAADNQEMDEKRLRQAGLGTDWDSLLAFLRKPLEGVVDAERIQRLIRQLHSEDFQEREQASRELKACGRPALESLRKVRQSDDPEVVRRAEACIEDIERRTSWQVYDAAIRRLVHLRQAEAVPALLEVLGHPDPDARKFAYVALCRLAGPKDLPDVLKAARHRQPHAHTGAIGLSFRYKDRPEVWAPLLLEALRDENVVVRREAALFLRHFGSADGVVPALIEALKDKDATPPSERSVPKAAAWSLETLGPLARPAVPGLMELSKAGHPLNCTSATLALGRLGGQDKEIIPTVVPFLVQILEDKKQPLGNRKAAIGALGLVGPDAKGAVPALREALKAKDEKDPGNPGIHNCVLSALGQIGPAAEAAAPDLAAVLQDKTRDRQDRESAAKALGAIGPAAKSVIPALTEALKKGENYRIKEAAARALVVIGPEAKAAVPALIEALKDEDPQISELAARGLGAIGPAAESAVPALTEALKDLITSIRQEAANALGAIGPAATPAIPALNEATKDPVPEVRQAAAEALKRIEKRLE